MVLYKKKVLKFLKYFNDRKNLLKEKKLTRYVLFLILIFKYQKQITTLKPIIQKRENREENNIEKLEYFNNHLPREISKTLHSISLRNKLLEIQNWEILSVF